MVGLILIAIGTATLGVMSLRWGADSRIVDIDGRFAGALGSR